MGGEGKEEKEFVLKVIKKKRETFGEEQNTDLRKRIGRKKENLVTENV